MSEHWTCSLLSLADRSTGHSIRRRDLSLSSGASDLMTQTQEGKEAKETSFISLEICGMPQYAIVKNFGYVDQS